MRIGALIKDQERELGIDASLPADEPDSDDDFDPVVGVADEPGDEADEPDSDDDPRPR